MADAIVVPASRSGSWASEKAAWAASLVKKAGGMIRSSAGQFKAFLKSALNKLPIKLVAGLSAATLATKAGYTGAVRLVGGAVSLIGKGVAAIAGGAVRALGWVGKGIGKIVGLFHKDAGAKVESFVADAQTRAHAMLHTAGQFIAGLVIKAKAALLAGGNVARRGMAAVAGLIGLNTVTGGAVAAKAVGFTGAAIAANVITGGVWSFAAMALIAVGSAVHAAFTKRDQVEAEIINLISDEYGAQQDTVTEAELTIAQALSVIKAAGGRVDERMVIEQLAISGLEPKGPKGQFSATQKRDMRNELQRIYDQVEPATAEDLAAATA